jgi:hypothetical protein
LLAPALPLSRRRAGTRRHARTQRHVRDQFFGDLTFDAAAPGGARGGGGSGQRERELGPPSRAGGRRDAGWAALGGGRGGGAGPYPGPGRAGRGADLGGGWFGDALGREAAAADLDWGLPAAANKDEKKRRAPVPCTSGAAGSRARRCT